MAFFSPLKPLNEEFQKETLGTFLTEAGHCNASPQLSQGKRNQYLRQFCVVWV